MHWEWIVPVIVLAVWILSSLIRNAEEPPRLGRHRRAPGAEPEADPLPSEVDKFLYEINKMRRQGAAQASEQPRPQPPSERPARAEAVPRERPPAPAPSEPDRSYPAPAPVVLAPRPEKPRQRQARPRRTEVARPLVAKVVVPQPGGQILDVIPVQQVTPPPAAKITSTVGQPRRPSPAVVQLRALLQTPGSMQTAILLQEVLGPPRCRRRR
jgi:hypothetical protein